MNRALLAIFTLAAMLLVSCSDDRSTPNTESADSPSQSSSSSESAPAEDALSQMTLDDGAKWKMDDHTSAMFARMAESFSDVDPATADAEALRKAGVDLQADIGELIQGCTMTGAAHDQLHVYLMGYIPAVAELSESGQSDAAGEVKRYLESYGRYFE